MIRFQSPYFLLLLILPPLWAAWRIVRDRRRTGILFSRVSHLAEAGRSWRTGLIRLPMIFRTAGLMAMVVALARPQAGMEKVQEIRQGIAIEMVLDRSGSMILGMQHGGDIHSRLDTAKEQFQQFVFGNGTVLGRKNDLVGMVIFARYPDTICPLTLCHDVLKPFLKNVRLADSKQEDGTAIGDAMALAAARLHTAEETISRQQKQQEGYQIKSKVMILLTDGENNCGRRSVAQAGKLLQEWGIKLYVISITGETAYEPVQTIAGLRYRPVLIRPSDNSELRQIAEETGGLYREVQDGDALRQVYSEIDHLERTQVESTRWVDYRELCSMFLLAALFCLIFDLILSLTVLRKTA